MKIKMNEILKFLNFYSHIQTEKMSLKLAYKLTKIEKVLAPEQNFYQKTFNQYLNEYGEKNEKGEILQQDNKIQIKKDKINECNEKLKELSEMEIDIEDFYFTLSELEELKLSPNEIEALLPFIKDE